MFLLVCINRGGHASIIQQWRTSYQRSQSYNNGVVYSINNYKLQLGKEGRWIQSEMSLQKRSSNGYPKKMHFLLLKRLLTCHLFNLAQPRTNKQPQYLSAGQVVATLITTLTTFPS
ncbi:hypothetical protein GLYMA_10G163900v4 [Glycine max]|uniref:Uncharacterized protein n=1 Tax=Glycine max TaxID=3847 RepID=A0A0R0HUD2_SOYBN|nr:hypothetical protein JHK87_028276 [Glycine soja]KAG4997594.1 hypothetical protein JHK85_029033 [Glycine max]KAG5004345.1 hypothetical protein JHK86_028484 [Glycine max]KAG5152139.1 hypothetical protein JHK84_028611 [Glycine max]KAH1138591.1 hypothetical protein GYH30_028199 [Glycine max]